jgi:hypothetical protein
MEEEVRGVNFPLRRYDEEEVVRTWNGGGGLRRWISRCEEGEMGRIRIHK